MRLGVVVAVLMLLFASAPAAAATDRTTELLAELDRCDPAVAAVAGPPLAILLGLADGRSAGELKDLFPGPTRCTGYVFAVGQGDNEVVLIGSPRAGDTVGAVLWVDRGWWRIVAARIGYVPQPFIDSRYAGARELIIGIASGGSAGYVGLIGLRLSGTMAWTILRWPPGLAGEVGQVRALDADLILVEGRTSADRLFTWNSHAGWPGGAQWLFERRGPAFVEIARRQARDPEYIGTGFIGALIARDAAAMSQFATPSAVAAALALPPTTRFNGAVGVFAGRDLIERERMSWAALPPNVRTDPPSGPAWGPFPMFEGPPELADLVLRFERGDDGWIVTDIAARPGSAPGDARLIP